MPLLVWQEAELSSPASDGAGSRYRRGLLACYSLPAVWPGFPEAGDPCSRGDRNICSKAFLV